MVIFGHTHKAKVVPFENLKGQKTVYANTGTWIDHSLNYPNSTFVVITEGGKDSPLTFVISTSIPETEMLPSGELLRLLPTKSIFFRQTLRSVCLKFVEGLSATV